MELDRTDLSLVNAAAKGKDGPILTCLHLTKGRIEATDGFILVRRELCLEEGEQKPETLLPVEMLNQIKPGKKEVLLRIDNTTATITYRKSNGLPIAYEPTYSFRTSQAGVFPITDTIFESVDTKKTAQIGVGVGDLKKLLACMPDNGHLRLGFTTEETTNISTSAIEFECAVDDRPIRGMLMPLLLEWSDFKWHRESADIHSSQ